MNYIKIDTEDVCNGDGLRVVLWLSSCDHHCYNCQNPQTWRPESGILFDNSAKQEIFEQLSKDYISGVTFTGGDPLNENNLDGVLKLTNEIRVLYPEKTIWLYSGYTWEEIIDNQFIDLENSYGKWSDRAKILFKADVFVDGQYIDSQRDISLKWRGSGNQRVIDVQKTLKQGHIVFYCD